MTSRCDRPHGCGWAIPLCSTSSAGRQAGTAWCTYSSRISRSLLLATISYSPPFSLTSALDATRETEILERSSGANNLRAQLLGIFFFDTSKSRKPAPGAPHTAHTHPQPRKASKQIAAQPAQLHKKGHQRPKSGWVRSREIRTQHVRPSIAPYPLLLPPISLHTAHCTHTLFPPTRGRSRQAATGRLLLFRRAVDLSRTYAAPF